LATAAVMVGVDPEIGMQTNLDIARETRLQGGYLDALRPGYVLKFLRGVLYTFIFLWLRISNAIN